MVSGCFVTGESDGCGLGKGFPMLSDTVVAVVVVALDVGVGAVVCAKELSEQKRRTKQSEVIFFIKRIMSSRELRQSLAQNAAFIA